jgi:O-antigen ligase
MAAVPLVFNTDTFDVFNLTKFTLVVLGAIVIAGLWIVEMVQRKKFLFSRTGIELPMIALLVASALATATTFAKIVSILGFYKSYDGLISIAAFTVLGLATVEVFDTKRQVRAALYSLVIGGGVLSAIYGAFQYVTFVTEGRIKLDWELWGAASFKTSSIFSTYGNPNHFAGFLAICIPVAIALLATTTDVPLKAICWIFCGLALMEILQAQSRGSWAAIGVVAISLVLLFLPDIRKRPAPYAAAGAAAVSIFLFAALALRGRTNLFARLVSMFSAGDSSSRQRVLLWEAGIRAGLDRPLFGWGLDTFRVVFLRYQGLEFFKRYGPTQVANGPHNVFISWFYSAGIVGIGAFLWMLGAVFVPAVRMANACRRGESFVASRFKRGHLKIYQLVFELREWRLLIGGTAIAVLSFLVVETFNVNQIGITFLLYTLGPLTAKLAYLSRFALAEAAKDVRAGTDELVPRTIREVLSEKFKGADGAETEEDIGEESSRSPSNTKGSQKTKAGRRSEKAQKATNKSGSDTKSRRKSKRQKALPERLRTTTAVVALLYIALAIPITVEALRPYRADHIYRRFVPDQETAKEAFSKLTQENSQELAGAVQTYVSSARRLIDDAIRRNPWESRYLYDKYEVSRLEGWLASSAEEQREALERADAALLEGMRLSPEEERFYKTRGELMNYWAGARGEGRLNAAYSIDRSKLPIAVESLLLARQYNPYDLDVDAELMRTALALGDRALIFDSGCHGFGLGDGRVTVEMAYKLAGEGYVNEAVELLRLYLRRFDYHGDVAKTLGDVTSTAAPRTADSAQSETPGGGQKQETLPPCVVELLGKTSP